MSHETNAILAINSTDRYINNQVPALSFFEADWGQDALNISIKQAQPLGASRPLIGSVVSANGLSPISILPNNGPVITDIQYTTENGSSILAGGIYTVLSLGDTDWAFIGAGSATPAIGTIFQATQNGIGNGSVKWISLAYLSKPTLAIQIAFVRVTQWTYSRSAQQPSSSVLYSVYNDSLPYSNNFTIQSPGALIYGYITKIIVSQIQLQYNIPTVAFGKNDFFIIAVNVNGTLTYSAILIPFGFYYPSELAAVLQVLLRAGGNLPDVVVTFNALSGFTFYSAARSFYFVDPKYIDFLFPGTYPLGTIESIYKTYRLLGITFINNEPELDTQVSGAYPNFLYTPYIDIYSDVLTNYQDVKDTNTSIAKPKGLVARVLLSGTGNLQDTTSGTALGSRSFTVTLDLNSPKVIKWSPDVAIPSIDFQLLDQYGDLIPGVIENIDVITEYRQYQTEFQMTLLCVEGRY
jgi:hypothetical protein